MEDKKSLYHIDRQKILVPYWLTKILCTILVDKNRWWAKRNLDTVDAAKKTLWRRLADIWGDNKFPPQRKVLSNGIFCRLFNNLARFFPTQAGPIIALPWLLLILFKIDWYDLKKRAFKRCCCWHLMSTAGNNEKAVDTWQTLSTVLIAFECWKCLGSSCQWQ